MVISSHLWHTFFLCLTWIYENFHIILLYGYFISSLTYIFFYIWHESTKTFISYFYMVISSHLWHTFFMSDMNLRKLSYHTFIWLFHLIFDIHFFMSDMNLRKLSFHTFIWLFHLIFDIQFFMYDMNLRKISYHTFIS